MTQINITDRIVIDGEIFTITGISGRWIKLSDGRNISRADAVEAREEYLDDEECLGEELGDDTGEGLSAEELGLEGDDLEEGKGSIVKDKYRKLYTRCYTATGRPSLSNGDQVASTLNGVPLATVLTIVTDYCPDVDVSKWAARNNGQKSMNARNAIRHAIRDGNIALEDIAAAIDRALVRL